MGRGRTSACPSPYSAGKYAPTPKTVARSFIIANVVSKGGILPIFFFFFKNRGSILHYRLVHFNPRPNRPEQCQLHENYVQELLILIVIIIICSGVNGFSPNSHVWKGVWVVLIVLRLTLSFSGTFYTCLSILTENTNSLFTVIEVLFKTSI